MNQTIACTLRDVYGVTRAYPANDQAARLAKLARSKTLTREALILAREMGFELVYVDAFGGERDGAAGSQVLLARA